MNTIDFDIKGECVIEIKNAVGSITFLGNENFDNSVSALERDLKECVDTDRWNLLMSFLSQCKTENIFAVGQTSNEIVSSRDNLILGSDDNGKLCATVYDLKAKHSGFWYASFNIRREIDNQKLKKQINEGYMKFCNRLEAVIEIIRESNSTESVVTKLCEKGFSETQAYAIISFPLNNLSALQKEPLAITISNCDRIITFLEKLDI